jgi:hypothetical protein
MEWVLKLEAKRGWGDVETIEVGRLERRREHARWWGAALSDSLEPHSEGVGPWRSWCGG